MKKYFEYKQSRKKGTFCIQQKEGRPTGLVASCVGTASQNTLHGRKNKGDGKSRKNS
jgi:hypothetical protein